MEIMKYIVETVAPIVTALATAVGTIGVVLLWRQLKETNKWNRANTQHTLVTLTLSYESEQLIFRTLAKYGPNDTFTIPPEKCAELRANVDDWAIVKTFLNIHEQLCAAVNAKALDEDYAYSVHNARVTFAYQALHHYIDFIRLKRGNSTIYQELERVARRWKHRADSEEEHVQRRIEEERKGSRGLFP